MSAAPGRRGVGVRALLTPSVLVATVVGAGCAVVALLVDGAAGLLAAVLATAVVLAFLLAGQLPVAQAARGRRGLGAMLLLIGYSSRLFLLLALGVGLTEAGGPERRVAGLTVVAVGLGWTGATVWSWLRWQPPVVDVELPGRTTPDGGTSAR